MLWGFCKKLTYLSLFSSGNGSVREKLWVNTSNPRACMVLTNQSTGIPLQKNKNTKGPVIIRDVGSLK